MNEALKAFQAEDAASIKVLRKGRLMCVRKRGKGGRRSRQKLDLSWPEICAWKL